jgi:hypothetical protein
MNAELWLSILSICISVAVPVSIFVARNWLTAWISGMVQHQFNVQLEELRSELRDREGELSTLRNAVLSGSAGRQALLDKRRFEAVEKVWTAVNDLAQLKGLSGMMATLNYKAIAEQANDPKMQQVLALIGNAAPDLQNLKNVARDERPFLPELAWAYFTAYSTILYGTLQRFTALKSGLKNPDKLFITEPGRELLKAVLPSRAQFIDKNEPETYHYLLEEVETLLLIELRKILEGKAADESATKRAKEIMDAVKHASAEQEKTLARKASPDFRDLPRSPPAAG